MNKEKEPLLIYIDKDLRTRIDDYIAKRFSKPYGALSYLAEEALRYYLELGKPPNTQIHKKHLNRIHIACMSIIYDLRENGFHYQFLFKDLRKSIGRVRGSDPRTVKKWCKILESNGYVKFISHRTLTFGPEISNPVTDVSSNHA